MQFHQITQPTTFKEWIWVNEENKRLLIFAFIVIIAMFISFKFFYPYPNFMSPDSDSYIEAAKTNQFINIWAIGYSKFLRLLSSFTKSSNALVWVQYLFLQGSLLYFLFSIRFLISPPLWIFRALLIANLLNPLIPGISNFVSSDCLFTALSLIWFTQLLWLLYKPTLQLHLIHAIILFLAFTVRYNSLYFPIISIAVALSISNWKKWIGIGVIIFLLSTFIISSEYEYKKQTGTMQFSAFGGWQIAANALYGYAHAQLDSSSNLPTKFHNLHRIVNQHMMFLKQLPEALRPDNDVGVYYLWNFKSPLRVYMSEKYDGDSLSPYFKNWASIAPLYSSYGRYIIWHHPWPYIKYYIWPNAIKYYVPPTGFMGYYNLGSMHVEKATARWFNWKNDKVSNHFNDKRIEVTNIFPILLTIINLVFITTCLSFFSLSKNNRYTSYNKKVIQLMLTIWVCNMIFSIVAAPIELRYQLFPMITTSTFAIILLNFIIEQIRFK